MFRILVVLAIGVFVTSLTPAVAQEEARIRLEVHPGAFFDRFTLSFELAEEDSLVLGVYDRANNQVLRLDLGLLEEGKHSIDIDGRRWRPGSFVVIVTGESGARGSTNVVKVGTGGNSDPGTLPSFGAPEESSDRPEPEGGDSEP